MKNVIILALIVLLTVCCNDSERAATMRSLLNGEKAKNESRQIFTTDSVVKELVSYYDRYGTANDRLLAHYLAGCAYRDLGNDILALQSYHNATDQSDTASSSCDYSTLSRVYGQMAELFLDNEMPQNAISALKNTMRYGRLAGDTLIVLQAYENMANAYYDLNNNDSVVRIREKVSRLYSKYGFTENSALALGAAIYPLVEMGEYGKARKYMDIYEKKSGVFDSNGNIESGREMYYVFKGEYYLKVCKYDSAEYYFRKSLAHSRGMESRGASFVGLHSLYTALNIVDSIAKYAVLCNITNDSIYAGMVATDLQRMQSKYDYTHNEKKAQQKTLEVKRLKAAVLILTVVFIVLLVLGLKIYVCVKHRLISRINEKESLYKKSIEEKSKGMADLEKKIQDYRQKEIGADRTSVEMRIHTSDVYQRFRYMADKELSPTSKDWNELRALIDTEIPSFYATLNGNGYKLRQDEYDICILIRLGFAPYELCSLTGKSSSYMSMTRQRMLKKIFNVSGKPKDFDRRVSEIF